MSNRAREIEERAKANQKQAGGAVPQKSAEAVETREEIAKLAGVSRDTVEEGPPGTVPECPAPAITARPMEGRDGGEGLAESLPQRVAFDSASIRQVTLFPARLKSS